VARVQIVGSGHWAAVRMRNRVLGGRHSRGLKRSAPRCSFPAPAPWNSTCPQSQGVRPGFARQVPSARHTPRGEFQGAWLAWLPTKLCLANDPFAVAPASLAGLVRPGIKEIEKVSHG
jgi:hypothetical protein